MNRALLALATLALAVFLGWDILTEEWDRSQAREIDPSDLSTASTRDELRSWIIAHPDDTSLLVWSYDPRTGQRMDGGIDHRPDEHRPAGTVAFLPLIVEWARAVPVQSDPIPLAEWEAWWLQGTPESFGHVDAVRRAGAEPNTRATVSEFDILSALVRSADPAAADWLANRVEVDDPPPPMLAVALAGPRHDAPDTPVSGQPLQERIDVARRFVEDTTWRTEEQQWRGTPAAERDWLHGQRLEDMWPTASPRALAELLARTATVRVQRGPYARLADLLSWPQEHADLHAYDRFGGTSFAAPGVVVEAAFAMEAGRPTRIVVLMTHGMAYRPWTSLVESNSHQTLVRTLLDDDDAVRALAKALSK